MVCLGGKTFCTYAGLRDRSAALAAGLRARGVPVGGRVVIYMGNRPEYIEILFGIWAVAVWRFRLMPNCIRPKWTSF